MNKSMLAVGIILLSLIALLLINVLTNFSTGSEMDYYLVKETVDAAVTESMDKGTLRDCGLYRIDREMFVESFLYRFINNVDNTREYDVYFYDINEVPPKVSVKVNSLTVLAFNTKENGGQQAQISTNYDAIVESRYKVDHATEKELATPDSDACKLYYDQYEKATVKTDE